MASRADDAPTETLLDSAVAVFVQAFALGKSRTHPYVATRHGPLWVMRDGPRKHGDPRKVESVGIGLPPAQVQEILTCEGVGWHFHCDVVPLGSDLAERKRLYKAAGYRAMKTEWVFVHHLDQVPKFACRPSVRMVTTKEEFARVPWKPGHAWPWFGHGRQYVVHHPDRPVGVVRSVPVGPDAWVSDLYVVEAFRRHGFGRALMARLLADDKAHGVRRSVLVASKAGAMLYPILGYELVGVLQVFCPGAGKG